MKKHYEEKLWDWLIKNFPEKTDARKIFYFVAKMNNSTMLNYMAEMEDKYKKELMLRPDSDLVDSFAFTIAVAKEIRGLLLSKN